MSFWIQKQRRACQACLLGLEGLLTAMPFMRVGPQFFMQTSKVRSVTSPASGWSSKAPECTLDLSDDSEERDNPEELYAQGIIDAVELQRLKNRAAQRRCAFLPELFSHVCYLLAKRYYCRRVDAAVSKSIFLYGPKKREHPGKILQAGHHRCWSGVSLGACPPPNKWAIWRFACWIPKYKKGIFVLLNFTYFYRVLHWESNHSERMPSSLS